MPEQRDHGTVIAELKVSQILRNLNKKGRKRKERVRKRQNPHCMEKKLGHKIGEKPKKKRQWEAEEKNRNRKTG